jgi:hypothetical protein
MTANWTAEDFEARPAQTAKPLDWWETAPPQDLVGHRRWAAHLTVAQMREQLRHEAALGASSVA